MKKIFAIFLLATVLLNTQVINAQVKKKPAGRTTVKKAVKGKKPGLIKKVTTMPAADSAQEAVSRVKIITGQGDIVIRLYNKTPKHRDNFLKLVKEHFYDSLLFHRVISGFMIQGGDPNSKTAPSGTVLGTGDIGYTIPAEFDTSLFHKKGALCAARTENPEKASSGCQFYIVQGRKSNDYELDNLGITNPARRMTYKMNGGTPFLDMNYTVFGEMESGMDVIDKIAAVATDGYKRPLTDVRMKMEIISPTTQKEGISK